MWVSRIQTTGIQKEQMIWAGEITQLSVLVALAEDRGLVLSTYMVMHNHSQLQLQRIQFPLWPPQVLDMHIVHLFTFE